jgi:hypothetical protein
MLGDIGDKVPDDGVAAMNLLAEDLNVANIHTAASVETTRNPILTKRIEVKWRNWTYMKTELLSNQQYTATCTR